MLSVVCYSSYRYEALVPGQTSCSVEYKGKLFCCASEEKLDKFMR